MSEHECDKSKQSMPLNKEEALCTFGDSELSTYEAPDNVTCPDCGRTLILDSRTYAFYPCHVCRTQVPVKDVIDGQ